jgi:tetratricopeptide (TPR) repeat protein
MNDAPKPNSGKSAPGAKSSAKPRSVLSGYGLRDLYFRDLSGPLRAEMSWRGPRQELFELNFCERIVARRPGHIGALEILGHLYTKLGEHRKGLEIDQRLVQLRPERPVAHYNLACSLSLTGQPDEALAELAMAVRLGYRDLEHMERDSDLRAVRADPRYKSLLAMLRSAVAAR